MGLGERFGAPGPQGIGIPGPRAQGLTQTLSDSGRPSKEVWEEEEEEVFVHLLSQGWLFLAQCSLQQQPPQRTDPPPPQHPRSPLRAWLQQSGSGVGGGGGTCAPVVAQAAASTQSCSSPGAGATAGRRLGGTLGGI